MIKDEKMTEVQHLISVGKEKGYLTYDELNNALPEDIISSDEMDSIMIMFGEMDIDIIDHVEEENYQKLLTEDAEEEEKEEKEVAIGVARTDDPVRLYLKEMGDVSLLSREGEIEIAKRIEEGKREIESIIFSMPFTINEVIGFGDQLKSGKVALHDFVATFEEEGEEEFEEIVEEDTEELRQKTLHAIEKLKRAFRDLKNHQKKLKTGVSKGPEKEKIKSKILSLRGKIVEIMISINLNAKFIDTVVDRLKEYNREIHRKENDITVCTKKLKCKADELQSLFNSIKGNRIKLKKLMKVTRETE